ncbi:flagellar protein FlaG [Clostridium ljungdahlii]|uniref:Flagellar protein FlaG n=1 Tax=Clostridium ljungdahlii (strain ATCC 55383 / DSM 13528 / PETC) TaxID=748727 RepID=D8GPW4_CLOLD|nr:flagellar protein FlaG [Clostridium ljungdahlii]ADK14023.1 predicted flagellar protein [Clostridium ljungdahlii DSM 13528]OAA87514.1 flagellar protein FlaG [Clostridium ljungdahlii DSM 13528]
MEVKDIGQGRQLSLDFNTSNNVLETQQSTDVIDKTTDKSSSEKKLTEKDVKKAVDKLNKLLEDKATHLKYEVCGKFNDITVQIIDDKTNKVIKEIPPKKIIEMVDKLCELAGVFLDKKV